MIEGLVIDVLLALAVAVELGCCLGLLVMRSALDRLHYASAATVVAPILVAAAVAVKEGLDQASINAAVVAAVLLLLNPVLASATGRLLATGHAARCEEPSA